MSNCQRVLILCFSPLVLGCNSGTENKPSQVGQFPIITIEYNEPTPPHTINLPHDYGFCIKWRDDESPRFYLYDKTLHKIIAFTDFTEFLNALQTFPVESKLDRIDGCCAGFSYEMPETERQKLTDVIVTKKFSFYDNEVVCTCESKRILFHKGNNESDIIEPLRHP